MEVTYSWLKKFANHKFEKICFFVLFFAVVCEKMTVSFFLYFTHCKGLSQTDMGEAEYCYVLLLGFISICLVG